MWASPRIVETFSMMDCVDDRCGKRLPGSGVSVQLNASRSGSGDEPARANLSRELRRLA